MFKVLISDSMSTVAQKIFEKYNIETEIKTGLSEKEIINSDTIQNLVKLKKQEIWRSY